jgi:hypothetical protein
MTREIEEWGHHGRTRLAAPQWQDDVALVDSAS